MELWPHPMGWRRGWDSNRGSEGDVPPSWGDRSEAEARGGRPPSGSVGGGRHATSNAHPLRHNERVGFEPGVLKGVFPLHGVTGAQRRRDTLEKICRIL